MSLKENIPLSYILPAVLFLSSFFYTLNNWGLPWKLSFIIGACGWFLGITAQTAFTGTW